MKNGHAKKKISSLLIVDYVFKPQSKNGTDAPKPTSHKQYV